MYSKPYKVFWAIYWSVSLILLLACSGLLIGEADENRFLRVDGFVLLCFALLGSALFCTFVLQPAKKYRKDGRPKTYRFRPQHLLCLVCCDLYCFWIIEYVNNEKMLEIRPFYILINITGLFLISLLLLLWSNSLRVAMVVHTGIWSFAAMVFYSVYDLRGEPLQIIDFTSLQTAFTVTDNYKVPFPRAFAVDIILGLCVAAVYVHMPKIYLAKKRKGKTIMRISTLAAMIVGYFLYMNTSWNAELGIVTDLFAPAKTYAKYGTTVGFFCVGKYMRLRAPEDYSVKETEEIAAKADQEATWSHTTDVRPANIIVIMNEAWADYSYAGKLETDYDPMPYYHNLEENTIKGHTLVCITGGGTAKTEYEFLTGNSVKRYPGMVPYVSYFTHDQYSLVTTLQSQGYKAEVMHPYIAKNWNRPSAYQLLNFERFYTEDDFPESAERIRGSISDKANYEKIVDMVEKKEDPDAPWFLFDITMQNHGGYMKSKYEGNIHINSYEEEEEGERAAVDRYLSLMKETDNALMYLIEYFRSVEEPTLIVMFGDHYPSIPDSIVENLSGVPLEELSLEEQQRYYATPFFIWANYDIPEEKDVLTSTNFLGTLMLEQTGLEPAPYNRYLKNLAEKMPALNHKGYVTKDGEHVAWSDEEDPYATWEWEYECLQYNELAKKRDRIDWFFTVPVGEGEP